MPLINTSYIRPGADWVPLSERARFYKMGDHKLLYNGDIAANRLLYPSIEVNGQTLYPDMDIATQTYPRVNTNLLKRLSIFWANSLFSRSPILDFASDVLNDRAAKSMSVMADAGYKVALNCSRYGTGLYWLTKNSRGNVVVRSLDPRYWIPIVDPIDQATIVGDVIAVPFSANPNDMGQALHTHISITTLLPGQKVLTQVYKFEQTKLGPLVSTKEGSMVRDRMIFEVTNALEEDHYGESDYSKDVIALVAEVSRRLSSNSQVMDKHTDPNIIGPRSLIVDDGQGNRVVNTKGSFMPMDKDDPKPEYLTWDGKLDANFSQVEKVLDQFFALTSTSRAALGIPDTNTAVASGAALRKHLFPSFQKISRLRSQHEGALAEMSKLMYGEIPRVSWPEPFVDGSLEFVQQIQIRLATGTMSRAQAIAELDLVPLSIAEKIAAAIDEPVNMNQNAGAGGQDDTSGEGEGEGDGTDVTE